MTTNDKVKRTKEYLKKEFGIKNSFELKKEFTKLQTLNIGIFISPIKTEKIDFAKK